MLQGEDNENSEAVQKYLGKEHEIHTVMFEGHLGSFDNQVKSLIHLKKQIIKTMKNLHLGSPIQAEEWKITDLD